MILERRKTFIWVLLLALFLGSVFPSGVRLLPDRAEILSGGSVLTDDFSCEPLPETVVQERDVLLQNVFLAVSAQLNWSGQTIWKSPVSAGLRLFLSLLLFGTLIGACFLISIIFLCSLWIPSTTTHRYIISYILSQPIPDRNSFAICL